MKHFILLFILVVISISGCVTDKSNQNKEMNIGETDIAKESILVSVADKLNLNKNLNIGETGISEDSIQVSVTNYKVDGYLTGEENYNYYPPDGAEFLLIYLKVTNIGQVKTPTDTVSIFPLKKDTPKIIYVENEIVSNGIDFINLNMLNEKTGRKVTTQVTECNLYLMADEEYSPMFPGYGSEYPNVSKEGWMVFVVPANIDLAQAELEIHGLKWNF